MRTAYLLLAKGTPFLFRLDAIAFHDDRPTRRAAAAAASASGAAVRWSRERSTYVPGTRSRRSALGQEIFEGSTTSRSRRGCGCSIGKMEAVEACPGCQAVDWRSCIRTRTRQSSGQGLRHSSGVRVAPHSQSKSEGRPPYSCCHSVQSTVSHVCGEGPRREQ